MGTRNKTTTTTTTTSSTRDIGFTGQAGVDLATNLALIGKQTSVDTIDAGIRSQEISATAGILSAEAAERTGARILESTEGFATTLLDKSNEAALIASNNLTKVVQQQESGFNRLVGGAGEFTRASSEFAEAQLGVASGLFDKIVGAARGVADQASNQAQAVLGSATSTIERLGPQTKQNQNIAFAGMAVAALTVGFLVFRRK